MNTKAIARRFYLAWPLLALFAVPVAGFAQVAVPDIEELMPAERGSGARLNRLLEMGSE